MSRFCGIVICGLVFLGATKPRKNEALEMNVRDAYKAISEHPEVVLLKEGSNVFKNEKLCHSCLFLS